MVWASLEGDWTWGQKWEVFVRNNGGPTQQIYTNHNENQTTTHQPVL